MLLNKRKIRLSALSSIVWLQAGPPGANPPGASDLPSECVIPPALSNAPFDREDFCRHRP